MFNVTVQHNLDEVFAQMDSFVEELVPQAVAIAMQRTGEDVKQAEIDEIARVFDQPTPWTLNSVYVSNLKQRSNETHVWLKDIWGGGRTDIHYLAPQIYGGGRVDKRSEEIMRLTGILPDGMQVVPGKAAKLDAYGNVSRGLIMQVMSALRISETTAGRSSDRTKRSEKRRKNLPQFFVSRGAPSHLRPGIWQRVGKHVKPILMFTRAGQYEERFDFHGIAAKVANEVMPGHLRRAMLQLASAR